MSGKQKQNRIEQPLVSVFKTKPKLKFNFDELRPLLASDTLLTTSETVNEIADVSAAADEYRCRRCAAKFSDESDYRNHYKSDWHTYNIRLTYKGRRCVTEEEFDAIVSDSDESSFSDSSLDSCGSTESKQPASWSPVEMYCNQSPFKYFISTTDTTIYAVYKCLINENRSIGQLSICTKYSYLLLAGGHFAGAVFDGNDVVVHKTFQRYMVRAKQGGAQSAKDGQSNQRTVKSAGASLRRYNALAMKEDIHQILKDWHQYIVQSDYIFLRCASYHTHIFFGNDTYLLNKSDNRLMNIPFVTKRPLFDEIKRVHTNLTTLYNCGSTAQFTKYCEDKHRRHKQRRIEIRQKRSDKLPSLPGSDDSDEEAENGTLKQKDTRKLRKADNSNESEQSHKSVLSSEDQQWVYTMVRTNACEGLQISIATNECITKHLLNHRVNITNQSLLHVAAAASANNVVAYLLHTIGCDPTVKDANGMVPYQVCTNKNTRQVFMKYRDECEANELSDVNINWAQAQIPNTPKLTNQQTEAAKIRAAEKRKAKKERDKVKKAEEAIIRKENEEKDRYLQLSDREKRALAAERRLLQSCKQENNETVVVVSRCFLCAADITSKVPFEYNGSQFCSIPCLQTHRKAATDA